jgi:hypothetical protein
VSGQFQVSTSALVSHAAEIDRIGDGLDTAKQAGAAAQVDSGAYGRLCQFVPALLNDLQAQVTDGIGSAVTAARDTADALRSTAADYDMSDGNAADRLRKTDELG